MGELKPPGKPFDISKWEVQDAMPWALGQSTAWLELLLVTLGGFRW